MQDSKTCEDQGGQRNAVDDARAGAVLVCVFVGDDEDGAGDAEGAECEEVDPA